MKREGQPQAIYETAIKLAIEVVKTEKVSSETGDEGDVAYNLALDHAVQSLSKLIFAVPPAVAGDEEAIALEIVTASFGSMPDPNAPADWRVKLTNRIAESLRSARAAQPAWRPIGTADSDQTGLFWMDWSDDCAPLNPALKVAAKVFMGKRGCWGSTYKATHWMPLPSQPAELEGER